MPTVVVVVVVVVVLKTDVVTSDRWKLYFEWYVQYFRYLKPLDY